MRKLLLLSAMTALPNFANAALISEFGVPISGREDYNGYELLYRFDPIASIPGTITNVQVVFSGTITPGVTNAVGTVLTATITPMISFSNNLTGSINTLSVPQVSYTGTPQTLAVIGNRTVGAIPEYASITSTNTNANFPIDEFSTSSYQSLTLFSRLNSSTGTGYFPNENYDLTNGGGSLELVVTYNTVPEPASLALLATSVLGIIAGRRRKPV